MHITQSLRVIHYLCLVPIIPFWLSGCPQQPQEVKPVVSSVKTMVVGDPTRGFQRTLTAQVRASERVELAFQVPGKIIELPVKKGQQVSQGDLIGRLDQRDYKSNLKSAQAEYDKAVANFKRGDESIRVAKNKRFILDEIGRWSCLTLFFEISPPDPESSFSLELSGLKLFEDYLDIPEIKFKKFIWYQH